MKLINTDGMAFIGPGSEWFWTAVGGLVATVTLLATTARSGFSGVPRPSRRRRQ